MKTTSEPTPSDAPLAPSSRGAVARHAGVVGLFTFASRIFGLIRDTLLTHLFGATNATDAFLMAFTIPNTFRMLVAEGSLTVAFLPVFREVDRKGDAAETRRVLSQALGVFPLGAVVLCALGILGAEPLVKLFAEGFSRVPGKLEQAVTLTRWMFAYLAMVSYVALTMGALNARRRFAAAAASPLVFNLVHISALLLVARHMDDPMKGVAWGVLAAGLGQVLVQSVAMHRAGMLPLPSLVPGPEVRRILRLMGPAIAALAVYQLNIMFLRRFTSFLDEGAVTYMYSADRFFQFPLGVFGISLATASLPALEESHADGGRQALAKTFRESLLLNSFINVPATAGLMALALPICATVFQHGAFTHAMAVNTARALVWLAVGLLAVSSIRITAQAFFAVKDTKTPAICGVVGLASNLALAPTLAVRFDFVGLAMSITFAAWAQLLVQLFFLHRRVGALGLGAVLVASLRNALAAAVLAMAAVAVAGLGDWPSGLTGSNAAVLVLAVGAGAGAYGLAAVALRADEAKRVLAMVSRRLRPAERA